MVEKNKKFVLIIYESSFTAILILIIYNMYIIHNMIYIYTDSLYHTNNTQQILKYIFPLLSTYTSQEEITKY